ncbi:hypothetical protein PF005_g23200 [Phytophthora fragariae]|uniref:Uncharacterized protein n=1 Tax=Phytophthora fragariae TaxID=53985 RepID=A0A6A3DVM6_9STRA|nr:hypothetical protein PF003_g13309 [Phytophthora fragariae]KAE8923361.1 hypothetical protein PF009_g26389 [Phytophthora fragariae]KAE8962537.1 hypothetical protein PF011_g29348 [Phytophthora fragariae]KAE9072431.1 hypothetical protein PF007_g26183 [Phytophthora fragariae]KAE9080202.1 hypothetical protein PF010_g22468 [Phytophthora fragariae]
MLEEAIGAVKRDVDSRFERLTTKLEIDLAKEFVARDNDLSKKEKRARLDLERTLRVKIDKDVTAAVKSEVESTKAWTSLKAEVHAIRIVEVAMRDQMNAIDDALVSVREEICQVLEKTLTRATIELNPEPIPTKNGHVNSYGKKSVSFSESTESPTPPLAKTSSTESQNHGLSEARGSKKRNLDISSAIQLAKSSERVQPESKSHKDDADKAESPSTESLDRGRSDGKSSSSNLRTDAKKTKKRGRGISSAIQLVKSAKRV